MGGILGAFAVLFFSLAIGAICHDVALDAKYKRTPEYAEALREAQEAQEEEDRASDAEWKKEYMEHKYWNKNE